MGVISEMALEQQEQRAAGFTGESRLAEQVEQMDDARQQAEADEARKILQKLQNEEKAKDDEADEDEKRRAHEEAEAKRKAEWEEKQREKAAALQAEWEKAIAVDDDRLTALSVKRLGDATERLTRRNMKLCVTEYVQTLCYEDLGFARLVMHPRKNMINCFHFINRKAREYLEKEMKDNDEKPMAGGYGGDVPDELCYQWAEEYFRDLDVKEDKTEEDEKFVPRPYRGISSTPKKKVEKKKPQPVKKEKPKEPEQLSMDNQITLDSFLQPEKMAG